MSAFSACRICPKNCGVHREIGETGFCHTGANLTVARAALHHWEEPCISGSRGSGTVFFAGCNLGCVFCQNTKISRGGAGKEITADRLYEIFFELERKGAHNITLVTPSHFLPTILPVIRRAKESGISIPFVLNCGGYESVDSLKALEGLIDIYLPDFKYISPKLAGKYSHAPNYAEVAKAALREMVRQQPSCCFSKDGLLTRGVIVRHLLLPGQIKDAKAVLSYLFTTYGNQIFISIMNQFTPTKTLENYPEINRKVTKREYETLIDYALSLGIEHAFIQEGETAQESFIPDFTNQGV